MDLIYRGYEILTRDGKFEILYFGEELGSFETLSATKAEIDSWLDAR